VALSASAFDSTRARSISAGCDDFLSKPVRFDQVLGVLERELKLTWLHADHRAAPGDHETAAPARRAAVSLDGLPRETARELYELALVGDVRLFMHRVGELRELDGELAAAIDELEQLGRSFDMKGLRARLRPLVEATT